MFESLSARFTAQLEEDGELALSDHFIANGLAVRIFDFAKPDPSSVRALMKDRIPDLITKFAWKIW
jgi:hypothetical protein